MDSVHAGKGNTDSTEFALPYRQSNQVLMNEAIARIKINKLLEAAGWRFFAAGNKPANICLEPNITLKTSDLDTLGNDFEKTSTGFIDFLLLDTKGFPYIVLEAKSEDKNPLVGKEQARKYAPLPELPLRHPVKRQPALLLGSGTWQPLCHHLLPDAGIGIHLPEGRARSGSA